MNLSSSSRLNVLRTRQKAYTIVSRASSTAPCTSYVEPTHRSSELDPATKEILERASTYCLGVYARPDIILSSGKGSWVFDTQGRKFLDFSAGIAVNALGHSDPGVTKVLTEQSQKLVHTSNVYHNEWAGKLAELLVTQTKAHGGLGYSPDTQPTEGPGAKVFFSNSGAEANEGALKIARKNAREFFLRSKKAGSNTVAAKEEIIHLENSFHGRTIAALSVTGNKKYKDPFGQLLPNVVGIKMNDRKAVLDEINEDTAAVIVEPIQGEGGVNSATVDWLITVRERCDAKGAILIFDEIQCGLFRTGSMWAHSSLPIECHPDIITMAKPLANGFPIGAVMMKDSIAQTMTPGSHGTTFGGSPLACAVGHYVLDTLSSKSTRSHIQEVSEHLDSRLSRLPGWFSAILQPELRGKGLIRGLAFRDSSHPGKVMELARDRGILILTAGSDAVRLVPSLNVGKEEVDFAVDVLESCISLLNTVD